MSKLTFISILLLCNINFASYAMQTTQNNEKTNKNYAQETCSLLVDLWYNTISLLQQNIDFNYDEENIIKNALVTISEIKSIIDDSPAKIKNALELIGTLENLHKTAFSILSSIHVGKFPLEHIETNKRIYTQLFILNKELSQK